MLTVVIETRDHEDPLARTLSSLVPAAVEGAVSEVIVCDMGSRDRTHVVAEHAGCTFLQEGGIGLAVEQARSAWLLLIEPGARLLDGWIEPVRVHTSNQTMPARFSRARGDRAPFLARMLPARRPLLDGLVITRRQAAGLSRGARSADALARGLAARRLAAQIATAPRPE